MLTANDPRADRRRWHSRWLDKGDPMLWLGLVLMAMGLVGVSQFARGSAPHGWDVPREAIGLEKPAEFNAR